MSKRKYGTREPSSGPSRGRREAQPQQRGYAMEPMDDSISTAASATLTRRRLSTPHSNLLLLFLGAYENQGIPPCDPWDYLTMKDLVAIASVNKQLRIKLKRVDYNNSRDGKDYLIPYPGLPAILRTPQDIKNNAGLFPHQLASLRTMMELENPRSRSNNFGTLRGGILGDAPGLGKTITMLALIANTAGKRPVSPPEFWDNSQIDECWKLMRQNVHARIDILKALKPIRSYYGQHPQYQALQRYVEPPYVEDDKFPTVRDFELHCFRELKKFVPKSLVELFRIQMVDFKAGLDKNNRKLLQSENGRRLQKERSLLPSSGTLIIVPDGLLEHWYQQIYDHLHLPVFADDNPSTSVDETNDTTDIRSIVYIDGVGDIVDATVPLRSSPEHKLPPKEELSHYTIVIIPFSRCSSHFRVEVSAGRMNNSCRNNGGDTSRWRQQQQIEADFSRSPFLQIRWLRMVTDEGHELGENEAQNDVVQFIHEIAAERRWVLSGTPTTGDEDDEEFSSNALDQIQRLLRFLRHPMYGTLKPEGQNYSLYIEDEDSNTGGKQQAKELWVENVKAPFLKRREQGRKELFRVLKEILVMHRKEDIQLPKPIFRQSQSDVLVPTEIQHEMMANIKMAKTMLEDYTHSEGFQTLVDVAQATYIVETIRKAQQALRDRGGGSAEGNIGDMTSISDFKHMNIKLGDLRPVKAVVYSSNSPILLSVTEHLYRQLSFENIAELYDTAGVGDLSVELSRFRKCFREVRTCPVCQRESDMISSTGKHGGKICQNYLLEVVNINSRKRFLIEPQRIVQATPIIEGGNVERNRLLGEPLTSYGNSRKFWRVKDILEVDVRDADHPLLPARWCEETWETYGSEKCVELARKEDFEGKDWYFGPLPARERPNSFTMRVKLVKWQRCGEFHRSKWYRGPSIQDVPIERRKEDVFVLSLDAGLSHGLDLSFVTHMFLLEPIEDAALLEQVTSRAHRLGATGPVIVDTVNTFYKISDRLEREMDLAAASSSDAMSPMKRLKEEKRKTLTKICCVHCFRQFESYAKAEFHEQNNCPRNPEIITTDADRFHLSSVYKEVKPPPAIESSQLEALEE